MTSVSLTVAIVSMVWVVLFLIIGAVIWFLTMQRNKINFIDVCLRTETAGKPQIDLQKGQIYHSKKYGNFIYLPKRKIPIPRFDQEVFLPSRKGGRMFLDVTTSDSYYYANKYRTIKEIIGGYKILTDDKGKKFMIKDEKELQKFLKDKYKFVDYSDFGGMVNLIPHVDRSQAVQVDEILANLNKENVSFWKSPQFIFISAMLISVVIIIVITVLTMQHANTIAGIPQQAGKGILNSVVNTVQNSTVAPR